MERKVLLLKTNGFAQILFCWAIKGTVIYRHRGLVRWIGQNYFKEWFINEAEYHFRVGFRKFWQDEDLELFNRFCDQKQRHFLIRIEKRKTEELVIVVNHICVAMAKSGKNVLFIGKEEHTLLSPDINLVCVNQNMKQKEIQKVATRDFDVIFVFGVTAMSSILFFKVVFPKLQSKNTMFVNFWLPGEKSSMYDTLLTMDSPLFQISEEY